MTTATTSIHWSNASQQEICSDGLDNNCDGRVDQDGGCAGGVNDSCETAVVISVAAGQRFSRSIAVNLGAYQNNTTYGGTENDCELNFGSGADAVYRLELAAQTTVSVVVTSPDEADTVLYVKTGCTDDSAPVTCSDDADGTNPRLEQTLPAGNYFLILDSFAASPGSQVLLALDLSAS